MVVLIPEARHGWSWRAPVVGLLRRCRPAVHPREQAHHGGQCDLHPGDQPAVRAALAPLLVREHVTRRDLEYMAVLVVGMALLLSSSGRRFVTAPDPFLGNVLAAGCAVSWALTVIGYRWVAHRGPAGHGAVAAAAITGNAIVFLIALPLALPLERGTSGDWLVVAYLGCFSSRWRTYFCRAPSPRCGPSKWRC
jgi:hypothetical protein